MTRYVIGNVISVEGLKIDILMNNQSNLETFHYDGTIYDGVSIGSYVGIIRGANKIIARVEKEYLEDKNGDPSSHEYLKDRFERRLEVRLIGNIYNGIFEFGIKHFPMIYNEVILLTQEEVGGILQRNSSSSKNTIPIGKSVSNNIPIKIAWDRLFNTHIGIFGNTGSGKSNTLTKLYTELFDLEMFYININFGGNSKFFFLDFNGEYVGPGVLYWNKKCLNLSTRSNNGDKLPLTPSAFWDIETLSILYSATEKTQRPFLEGAVKYFLDKELNDITTEKIINGLGSAFYNLFKQNNSKETLLLLNKNTRILEIDTKRTYCTKKRESIDVNWLNCLWHSNHATYYLGEVYVNNVSNDTIKAKRAEFEKLLSIDEIKDRINKLSMTEKLRIAVNCHMIYCLSYGRVQFDYVNPLIQRIETRSSFIEKTICIENKDNSWGLVNVISLRNCNSDSKKMIPLLIVKQLYNEHKEKLMGKDKITSTVHLVIDEAHNILSEQSTREAEAWKDYRLEVFEEIIKEGRKFGFFITLASQRPYDISPTIVSQLHNFFIHRLVNEQDLKMIANTVTSLDSVSRAQIPALAPGQCIITGTSFEMPLLIQVDKLEEEASPASENADLVKLWT
jgi:hypothetical protein